MIFRLYYGIVFMIDFSYLSGIRSFGRDLLGFLRVGEWRRNGLGLDCGVFRVEWVVNFVLILFGFVRRGVSNGNYPKLNIFFGLGNGWVMVSSLILRRVSRVELLDTREQI